MRVYYSIDLSPNPVGSGGYITLKKSVNLSLIDRLKILKVILY